MNPKKLALFVLFVFISALIFSKGVINREINIQCPSLNVRVGDEVVLQKINRGLYEHSLYAFHKDNSGYDKEDLNIWYVSRYESEYKVTLHDDRYLSVYFDQYIYDEGAMHGTPYGHGVTFDKKTGEEVSVEDILQGVLNYKENILDYIEEDFDRGRLSYGEITKNGFYITKEAIYFLYYEDYGGGCTYELPVPFYRLKPENSNTDDNTVAPKSNVQISEMIKVEKGTFTMGNTWEAASARDYAQPVHEVELKYDYSLGKTEVTNEQFIEFLNEVDLGSLSFLDPKSKIIRKSGDLFVQKSQSYAQLPVVNISWGFATSYCNWLSEKTGLKRAYDDYGNLLDKSGNITIDITKVEGFRLPTEAEWEYAARGGQKDNHSLYPGSDDADTVAWYWDNSTNGELDISNGKGPHPVTEKTPNELGLYGMAGNAREWCHDYWWQKYYENASKVNPINTRASKQRSIRGGDWLYQDYFCRVYSRSFADATYNTNYHQGFRVARTWDGKDFHKDSVEVEKIPEGQIKIENGLAFVEKGQFKMGDEWGDLHYYSRPTFDMILTYDYEIGQYEVTNAEFVKFLNDVKMTYSEDRREYSGRPEVIDCMMNGHTIFSYSKGESKRDGITFDGNQWRVKTEHNGEAMPYEKMPVVYVTWYGAMEYCNWLSRKERLESAYIYDNDIKRYRLNNYPENKGYRLPTEAEWEYAARGGKYNQGNQYAGSDDIDEVGWYRQNSGEIQVVGLKLPNELGIYDMSGNVSEWCVDNFSSYDEELKVDYYYQSQTDKDYDTRIEKGGNCFNPAEIAQIADHSACNPGISWGSVGFRVARSK